MKKATLLFFLMICVPSVMAQAYRGEGDRKLHVGLNMQNRATGITSTVDFGIGENMSYGFNATYLLNTSEIGGESAAFGDKIDFKVRFNANIGNVLNLGSKMDVYPGLNLGTRNFGAHLGFRHFFSNGFGVFAEGVAPLARFKNHVRGFDHFNNQVTLSVGAAFNF